MRLADCPDGCVRRPLAGPALYLPPPTPPAPRPRPALRAVLVAVFAGLALVGTAPRTGDQSVLAPVLAERPAWAAALKAPDPGVALSPHVSLAEGRAAAVAAPPDGKAPPADAGKGDLLMTELARTVPKPLPLPQMPGLLAAADPQTLPRVALVRHDARTARAKVGPGAADAARAAATSVLSAYAPERVGIETPFRILLGPDAGEGERPHGVSGNGRDHWWSDRPLPETITSKKSIKCLAEAVYFEARGESETGQKAVAQVVVNRVKNPAYPDDVCSVVYQNRNMFKRCQFTFACDRIRDVVRDGKAWETAVAIAKSYAAGEAWLPAIGASTHYHADYVSPSWASLMRRVKTIGAHHFYITRGGGWT